MRQVTIDYARTVQAAKRGRGQRFLSLDTIQVGAYGQADFLLAIDAALEKSGEASTRLSRVFECRYFGGLTEQETVDALGVPLRTVQRDWMKSKAWLRRELTPG